MTETNAYTKFAEMMLHQNSEFIPRILESMITSEQADLLVSLPGTASQMAEKMGRDAASVDADLKAMFRMGLTFKKEKDGDTVWRAPAHLVQFHDATLVWPEATEEFIDLWQHYMEKEWPELAPQLTQFIPRPFTRVIPVGKSVDAGKAKVLAPDSVREIIASAKRIAVTKCTCRLTMKKCDAPIEVCLQINRGADYTIERGSGRELTKEEALDVIEKVEEAGLVHVTMNKTDAGHFICNCCGCCCQSFTLLISDGVNLCDPSRYKPEVDTELCTGCGTCEDRCWFNAITVGENDTASVDEEKCLGCGQCYTGCPEEAITMVEVRAPDFIPG